MPLRRFKLMVVMLACGLSLTGCGPGSGSAPPLAPVPVAAGGAARGKVIYTTGARPDGTPIVARLNGVVVPSAAVTCRNCHGPDGRGRAEGGVTPSAIDWDTLSRPAAPLGGRQRPAYDDAAVGRAITAGLDPAPNPLNVTMPRYEMSAADLADLTAYLKVLGREPEPGVTDDAVCIGVLLPAGEPDGVRQVLTAYADKVNAAGGLYRRAIAWRFVELPAEPTRRAWASREFLEKESVFACVGLPAAQPAAVAALFEETGTPLVGPSPPTTAGAPNPVVFSLYPSAGEQAHALVAFAVERAPRGTHRAVVIAADGDAQADAIARRCEDAGCPTVVVRGVPAAGGERDALVRGWHAGGRTLLFNLMPARDLPPLLAAGVAVGWHPTVLAAGAGVGAELFEPPAGFTGKAFLPLPELPPDETSEAAREYRALTDGRPRTGRQVATEVAALTAAKTLVEGLKRTGRDLSRAQLIRSLEGLVRFETGLSPPLTFGPGRRVGARGAYAVAVDAAAKTITPTGPWIEIDRSAERR